MRSPVYSSRMGYRPPNTPGCEASLIDTMSGRGRFLKNWLRFITISSSGVRKATTWTLSILKRRRFVPGLIELSNSSTRLPLLLQVRGHNYLTNDCRTTHCSGRGGTTALYGSVVQAEVGGHPA